MHTWWDRNGIRPGVVEPSFWRLGALLIADACVVAGLPDRNLRAVATTCYVPASGLGRGSVGAAEHLSERTQVMALALADGISAILETDAAWWPERQRAVLERRREYALDIAACCFALFQMCCNDRTQQDGTHPT